MLDFCKCFEGLCCAPLEAKLTRRRSARLMAIRMEIPVTNHDGSSCTVKICGEDALTEICRQNYLSLDEKRLHITLKPSAEHDDDCKLLCEDQSVREAGIISSSRLKLFLASGDSDFWQTEKFSLPAPPLVDGERVLKQGAKKKHGDDQSVKSKRAFSEGVHQWILRCMGTTESSSVGVCTAPFYVKKGIQGNSSGYTCYTCGGEFQGKSYSEGLLVKGGAREGDGVDILEKGLSRCHKDGDEITITLDCDSHTVAFRIQGDGVDAELGKISCPSSPLHIFVTLSDVGHGWELVNEDLWMVGSNARRKSSWSRRGSELPVAFLR